MSDAAKRSPSEQQKLDAAIKELFEHKIVFNEYLGFTMGEHTADSVSIDFKMRPELIGHYMHGRLHGGVISAVLDAAGGLAVIWKIADFYGGEGADQILGRFKALATIDLRVDYLRPGVGDTFTAKAKVIRLGRRIAATHAELRSNEVSQIATSSGTYIVS